MNALKQAKRNYDNQCLICNSPIVDGCHIFPRVYKTAQSIGYKLRENAVNIVPLCRFHHVHMDWRMINILKKNPWARIKYLKRFARPEYRVKLFKQIEQLREVYKDAKSKSVNKGWQYNY